MIIFILILSSQVIYFFISLWNSIPFFVISTKNFFCNPTIYFIKYFFREGILPALEPSHALAYVMKIAPKLDKEKIIVMNLCGRGDKDVFTVADALGVKL